MQFISYLCVFSGKISEINILINENLVRKNPGFFNISLHTSRVKIESGSRELNPSSDAFQLNRIFHEVAPEKKKGTKKSSFRSNYMDEKRVTL